MWYRHVLNTAFYNNLYNDDLSTIAQDIINKFAEKYKLILTNNEHEILTKRCQILTYFKSKEINKYRNKMNGLYSNK